MVFVNQQTVNSRQTASAYDPNKAQGKGLAQEWRDLFDECRKRFNENLLDIPIANKAYRLNMLDRMARDAEKSKNRPLAAALAEQAAKEMGEVFTNKQKVDNTSSDGSMATKPTVVRLVAPKVDKNGRAIK